MAEETTEIVEIGEITARAVLSSAETSGALKSSMGWGNFYFTIVVYFIVLTLIIVGFIYLRRYLLSSRGGMKSGSGMKIKDRLIISPDKQIILLEVKNKVLMLGISTQSISALGEFEKDEILTDIDENTDGKDNKFAEITADSDKKDGSFFSVLREKIKTGFDNFDKNKKD